MWGISQSPVRFFNSSDTPSPPFLLYIEQIVEQTQPYIVIE